MAKLEGSSDQGLIQRSTQLHKSGFLDASAFLLPIAMSQPSSLDVLNLNAVVLISVFCLTAVVLFRRRSLSPPGPRGWPIIGNALNLPSSKYWLTYDRWAKKYGTEVRYPSRLHFVLTKSKAMSSSSHLSASVRWS